MNKKAISIILAGVMMVTSTMPAFGMSILDATINAGADRVSNSSSAAAGTGKKDTSDKDSAGRGVGCTVPRPAAEAGSGTINDVVFAGNIDISGMSETEAKTAVNGYVADLGNTQITLNCVSGNQVNVPASSLGLYWKNTDIINDALTLGQSGNVIKRFKELTDLKKTNKVYPVVLGAVQNMM